MAEDFNPFSDALSREKDISESWMLLGDMPSLLGLSMEGDQNVVERMRRWLTRDGPLSRLDDIGGEQRSRVESLYDAGLIAAVDGTDAVAPVRTVADTLYACGVVLVTPKTVALERSRVTRTLAAEFDAAQDIGRADEQSLQDWADYLENARDKEKSWVSTFREYHERKLGIEWCREDANRRVLIDGPLLTQNLLTQDPGRELLLKLVERDQAIGFLKDISANPLVSAVGHALEAGEVYVIASWTNLLSQRFDQGQQTIARWIKEHAAHVVRAVYKVNAKAYCIECPLGILGEAVAILGYDPGGTWHHDIPMLLQLADSEARGRFKGHEARDELLARFAQEDPQRFIALTNERNFR